MAFIDETMETNKKKKVHVRVPSSQGGTDRTVYINGNNSGYYLGASNNHVYRGGREVAKNLKDLVENVLGETGGCIFAPLFLLHFHYILYNKNK